MPAERKIVSIQVTLENNPKYPEYGRPVITRVVVDGQDVTKGGKAETYDDESQAFVAAHGADSNWWALLVAITSDTEIDWEGNPWMNPEALGDEDIRSGEGLYGEPYEPLTDEELGQTELPDWPPLRIRLG